MSLNNSTLRLITSTRESKIMTTFNFLTGKAYKARSDIDNALQKAIKDRKLEFTGFATITQARKQFIKVKAGAKGIKCPISIAGGQVRYFYLFPMQDFTTCIDKRSQRAQKADPNSDQHDRIIRYALPGKITDKEKSELIAAAHNLTEQSQKDAIKRHKNMYDTYMYDANVDIDTYKVDIYRRKHELEDLQAQAQVSGIDYTQCGYDTNKEILKIDTDAYNNANDIVDTQSMSTYDYNLQNVIENKIVQMLKQ
jgi:hypothetical protein